MLLSIADFGTPYRVQGKKQTDEKHRRKVCAGEQLQFLALVSFGENESLSVEDVAAGRKGYTGPPEREKKKPGKLKNLSARSVCAGLIPLSNR